MLISPDERFTTQTVGLLRSGRSTDQEQAVLESSARTAKTWVVRSLNHLVGPVTGVTAGL